MLHILHAISVHARNHLEEILKSTHWYISSHCLKTSFCVKFGMTQSCQNNHMTNF